MTVLILSLYSFKTGLHESILIGQIKSHQIYTKLLVQLIDIKYTNV